MSKKTQAPKETSAGREAIDESALQGQSVDPLLQCLAFLTEHYGRAKSPEAIRAGLAYDSKGMGPNLFCEAAQRLNLKTRIVKRPDLESISAAVLPALLILKDEQACILLDRRGGTAKIYSPETGAIRETKLGSLRDSYAGYAILVHAESGFANPDLADLEDPDRHWFWGVIRQSKSIYGMVLIGAIFINLFALVSPLFIMNVYDRVIPNNAIETGWALGIGALTIFVFDLIMRSLRAYLIDLASRRIDVVAGRRIYDQVLNMKLALRPKSSGSFANMLKDFDTIRDFFTSATVTALVDLPFSLFFLFIIYQLAGPVAFVLLGLIAAVVVIGFFIQAHLKTYVRNASKTAETKHGLLVETIHGLETIKSVSADGRFRARYTEMMGENAEFSQAARFWSGLGVNIATFLQQIASIIIVLMGMYMVQDGDLSVGALIACVILGGRAIAPIGQIANLMARYHQANGALKTLDHIMSQDVDRPAHRQFLHRPDLQGKIAFEKVNFTYPQVKSQILHGVSFTINPGERVGIIGRIGSGKSTIARLIVGLYEPDDGTILADDTDYRQIDPADLRRNIAYISQDVFLFTGSVRDNIAASLPGATEEQILNVSKIAGVHDFVARHPMGYDAPVGEHGAALSGGQRQAIALARAMLLNPKIMVCDEPTNAMDMQAEATFKKYIEEQIGDKTFIMITHKNTMLTLVDRLILLDQGRVMMDGTRERVLEALQTGQIQVPK
jgi:ATP-binding cassette subfamily C protein LapB